MNASQIENPSAAGAAERRAQRQAVAVLAESCAAERDHARHVADLGLQLFDALQHLHRLAPADRFCLECAAVLHDIGWLEGRKGHHKSAMRRILAAGLPFTPAETMRMALVARYHRKAMPCPRHRHYVALDPVDQHRVAVLGGILRIADGLDRTHRRLVQTVSCRTRDTVVEIIAGGAVAARVELAAATKKSDLLQRALGRRIIIDITTPAGAPPGPDPENA